MGKSRSIYDAGVREIIWKNFLAGVSRGVGTIFVYFLIFFVVGVAFIQYAWPVIAPFIARLEMLTDTVQSIGTGNGNPLESIFQVR